MGLRNKFMASLVFTAVLGMVVLAASWSSARNAVSNVLRQNETTLRETARAGLQARAEQLAEFLADALTNPVYYFDLLAMREMLRSALAQPDVRYMLVYDDRGRLIHDGSTAIGRFGLVMEDALAAPTIQATAPTLQWSSDVLDASAPIAIGDLRLGGVRIGLSTTRMEQALARDSELARSKLREQLAAPARVLLFGLALVILWVLLASWLVGRGLVRPIHQLAARAREIEQGRYLELPTEARKDELGELMRAFERMRTGVARHHEDIRNLAYRDSLTGLPNRLSFRELLEQMTLSEPQRESGMALLFIDLDDFKRINDTFGHDTGDGVLVELANRLRTALAADGAHPAIGLARLGGDEFVALISGPDARRRGAAAAEAVLSALAAPFLVADKALQLSASVGLTLYPEDASSAKLLLKQGDLAMYQAKLHGKRCYRFFARNLTQMADESLALEHELRIALQQQSLALSYQPIFALNPPRLVAAEALLRWQHPTRGAIAPSVFVPIAEATGLMEELGHWVITRACRDAAAWQQHQPGVAVAINVSGQQLQRSGLAERIAAALAAHRLDPALLHVELTESTLLRDEELAFAVLAQLRKAGVKVWLDDFGTGYSGLSHLRRARVDGVKIDRSFVAEMTSDAEDLALSSAIIAMAHSLGMQVIAEGVETAAQLTMLAQRNCDLAQGFWLSVPVSAEQLSDDAGLIALRALDK